MRDHASFAGLCLLVVLSSGLKAQNTSTAAASATPEGGRIRAVEHVIQAALALLPKKPAYVSLIDVDAQSDARVREALRPLEAFTLAGKEGVYVTLHGATLRRAAETREERIYRFDIHVLAGIVWHEMAHLAGADEAQAQAREEELWTQFIRAGAVNMELGLRQLQIYASRRPRRGLRTSSH